MPDPARSGRPLIFGEILFDAFPDGSAVLGGAPFNVAWHLQGFGLHPLLVTRVGRDVPGERVLDTMRAWGMDTTGVQQDEDHPTGAVTVALSGGEPTYEIIPDQAWDHIAALPVLAAAHDRDIALIYHGTLALRGSKSREALRGLRELIAAPVCIDVNLRSPWWGRGIVAGLLRCAGWVKMNDTELATLIGEPLVDALDLECAGVVLRRHHAIDTLIVTRGADGALVIDADGIVHGGPAPVEALVDTVGAGDAFSAVALLGRIEGWPAAVTLARALRFASDVCAMRGATAPDRALYTYHLERWKNDEPA